MTGSSGSRRALASRRNAWFDMAEETEIAWCDSTFNPWWGCSPVGPECANCYARSLDIRTGGDYWGPRKTPRAMSESYWRNPWRWDRDHAEFAARNGGRRRRVFAGSMCDWADNHAPGEQRERFWNVVRETRYLNWLLLTKRHPNIRRFLPPDWGNSGYENAWLGVSVGDRKHGLPRIDALREIPAKVRFLSIEPLLEDPGKIDLTGIGWVIVGAESGSGARPMDPSWARSIKDQCTEQDVPFFFKQLGGRRSKGGCLLDGMEYKEWPRAA